MAQQLIQEEGDSNTGIVTFKQWLAKWEFSNLDSVEAALTKQGITSSITLKKFVVNEAAFNKLISMLDLNFVDQIALERAWKSVHVEDEEKVVFLGDAERKVMSGLFAKYDAVSKDVETLQNHTTQIKQNKVESLKILSQNAQKMIKIIQQNQEKISKEIEVKVAAKSKELNDSLKILMAKRKIYAQRKEEFEKIALQKNMDKTQKLQKLKSLLVVKNEQKMDKVELALLNVSPLDEGAFDKKIYSLLNAQMKSKECRLESVGIVHKKITFSANHGHVGQFQLSNDGKTVKQMNNTTVLCATGYNSGIHSWKVKGEFVNGAGERRIGIINSLDRKFRGHGCCLDGVGLSYMWRAGKSYYNGGDIYACKDGKSLFNTRIKKIWESGSIVTVILNCDDWTLEFLHDGKQVTKFDIEPNQTYYPAFHAYQGPVTFDILD